MAGNLLILYPVHAIFTVVSFVMGCISEYGYYTNVRMASVCDRRNPIPFIMYRFGPIVQSDFGVLITQHSRRWNATVEDKRPFLRTPPLCVSLLGHSFLHLVH